MGDTPQLGFNIDQSRHVHKLGASVLWAMGGFAVLLLALGGVVGHYTGSVQDLERTLAAEKQEKALLRNDIANLRRAVDLNQELDKIILARGAPCQMIPTIR